MAKKASWGAALALLLIALSLGPGAAKSPAAGDPKPPGKHSLSPAARVVAFFRDHISAVDGDRCPSRPTCSQYSLEAFQKHGFLMGWLMTVDRLIHEGREEAEVSPLVLEKGRLVIHDPLENNDFWWYPRESAP